MSTISASTTSTTAFKVTSDTTGTLVFQTGAVPTTAISIDASQVVSIGNIAVTGASTFAAGTAAAPSITTTGDTNTGIFFPAADTIAFTEGGVEAMRINSSANVGIGATTPSNTAGFSRQLQIEGTTAALTLSGTTGTGKYTLGVPGANAVGLWDNTASAYRWYVDSSGNLGIGITSPSTYGNLVLVRSQNSDTRMWIRNEDAGSSARASYVVNASGNSWSMGMGSTANNGNALTWLTDVGGGNNEMMRLTTSGNLGLGVTPSAWETSGALQLGTTASTNYSYSKRGLTNNAYYDGNWRYYASAAASLYQPVGAVHSWYNAASGTAGNVISFTEAMRLDASGNLGIAQGNAPTQVLSLYRTGSTQTVMSAGNSNTGLNGTLFGVDTAGNGIINQTQALPLIFSTSNTERMRIASDGKVGIASTNPGVDLQIGSDTSTTRALSVRYSSVPLYLSGGFDGTNALNTFSANAYANATGSGQSWTSFSNTSYGASAVQLASSPTGADIRFLTAAAANTNPTERARISSAGQVFIGGTTNSYNSALHLFNVNGGTSGSVLESYVTGTTSAFHAIYLNANGAVGSISTSGTATAFNTSSDYRLKNTIAPMTGALAKVALLKPCTYKWNADGSDGQGFIAHELAEVVPQCVTGEKDAVDAEGKPRYQGVDTSFLVATLTAAIQELTARVAQLESK